MTGTETVITNPDLTAAEIEKALHYLTETRAGVLEAVAGLSPEQWAFKPAPERWSIAETLEHIALIEGRVHLRIREMGTAPEAAGDAKGLEMDEMIVREIPIRNVRIQAPAAVQPTSGCSGPEALEQFVEARQTTIQLLAAPHLRGRVQSHPVFGPWDGYQWVLAGAAHSARHTGQILEVKSTPGFPA